MSDLWNRSPEELKLEPSESRPIAKRAAKQVEISIRKNIENADYGPDGTEGAPKKSTKSAWFNITEPSGKASKFRSVIDSAHEGDKYVEIEGGYAEYSQIYDGRHSDTVHMNLTGSMLKAMYADYGVDEARRGFDAGVAFQNRSDNYTETTPTERARLVNEQYEFLYLKTGQKRRIFKQVFDEFVDELSLKVADRMSD